MAEIICAANGLTSRGAITVVNITPPGHGNEEIDDSEPYMSSDPRDRSRIVVSAALTPGHSEVRDPPADWAPLFLSQDGGSTWLKWSDAIPAAGGLAQDFTHGVGRTGFWGAFVELDTNEGRIVWMSDPFDIELPAQVRHELSSTTDQPTLAAGPSGQADNVFVGWGLTTRERPTTAMLDYYLSDAATWQSLRLSDPTSILDRNTVRTAIASDGTVYSALASQPPGSASDTFDIVLVRVADVAPSGSTGLLLERSTIAAGLRIQACPTFPCLGRERIGSALSLAVHPDRSGELYVAYGATGDAGELQTIRVRRSIDRGETWSEVLYSVPNATNPALAIASSGTVGLLYQKYVSGGCWGGVRTSCWETVLSQASAQTGTWDEAVLARTPNGLFRGIPSDDQARDVHLPFMSDYGSLEYVDGAFRGVFSVPNTPLPEFFPHGAVFARACDHDEGILLDAAGGGVSVSTDVFYFRVVDERR